MPVLAGLRATPEVEQRLGNPRRLDAMRGIEVVAVVVDVKREVREHVSKSRRHPPCAIRSGSAIATSFQGRCHGHLWTGAYRTPGWPWRWGSPPSSFEDMSWPTSGTVRTLIHVCGSIRAMRTTIDRAGRLVIPSSLRNRIGLAGGGEVEIALDGAAIRIEPVAGTELREDGGLLFIPAAGTPIDNTLVRELIDADRHGR